MGMTLAQLINCAKPASGPEIDELAAILAGHPEACAKPLTELLGAEESPVLAVVHEVEDAVKAGATWIAGEATTFAHEVFNAGRDERVAPLSPEQVQAAQQGAE